MSFGVSYCLKRKYISQLESRAIPGFIEFVSLQPFTVALWTETNIEFLYKMLANHSLLVDATGSIATKLSDKEIFYFTFISYYRSVQTEPVLHMEILIDISTTNTLKFILMRFLEDELKWGIIIQHIASLCFALQMSLG